MVRKTWPCMQVGAAMAVRLLAIDLDSTQLVFDQLGLGQSKDSG